MLSLSTPSRRHKVGNYLGPVAGELPWPFRPYSGDIPWASTRVRTGSVLSLIGGMWSNVVRLDTFSSRPSDTLTPPWGKSTLAPVLSQQAGFLGVTELTWTTVPIASNYVLERSTDPKFSQATEVYSGVENKYPHVDISLPFQLLPMTYYYRVRASLLSGRSGWSNVVEIVTQPRRMSNP